MSYSSRTNFALTSRVVVVAVAVAVVVLLSWCYIVPVRASLSPAVDNTPVWWSSGRLRRRWVRHHTLRRRKRARDGSSEVAEVVVVLMRMTAAPIRRGRVLAVPRTTARPPPVFASRYTRHDWPLANVPTPARSTNPGRRPFSSYSSVSFEIGSNLRRGERGSQALRSIRRRVPAKSWATAVSSSCYP